VIGVYHELFYPDKVFFIFSTWLVMWCQLHYLLLLHQLPHVPAVRAVDDDLCGNLYL
jgi:hypothetical protein